MDLAVGAASRLVVEVAAELKVPQIVASRRQVDIDGGYTGLDQYKLVGLVKDLSDGDTQVVRDHGGPNQTSSSIPAGESFTADIRAGFDVLHLDVCKAGDRKTQIDVLTHYLEMYRNEPVQFEVGDERGTFGDNLMLARVANDLGIQPLHVVIDLGGFIHADKQYGSPKSFAAVSEMTDICHMIGSKSKAHNMDWAGDRMSYDGALDTYNVAPEWGNVEIDAWLRVLPGDAAMSLLDIGLRSKRWTRWFNHSEGTRFERARAGLRYLMDSEEVRELLKPYETFRYYVREEVRDALLVG